MHEAIVSRIKVVPHRKMPKNFLATQHIPAFVDTDDPPEQATFSNTNELLMIENEDGTWWWCVAKVTKGSLNLPIARMTTSRKN